MPEFSSTLDLSALDGITGFQISAEAAGDMSGRSVAGAGDVNGDGFADLLIGSPQRDIYPDGASGKCHVVFGKAGGFAANLELSKLKGATGFEIRGEAPYDACGYSVSSAGDFNGDGFSDLIIGAPYADRHGSRGGASYVVFGKATGFSANFELSALNGANGFELRGVTANSQSGFSVASAGDVNADGFDDIIVGDCPISPGDRTGASYVVFGKAGGFAADFELSGLDGSNGFKISGEAADDFSGLSVSGGGDINGDGFADMIVASPYADPNGAFSGASYVVFGKASGFAANFDLSALDGANGFEIRGEAKSDRSGRPVANAGDINADGFDDLIIGAASASPNDVSSGASYVVFGKASGFAATLELSALNGANGFEIKGEAKFDNAGRSVSAAGDVNGDGYDDLIIGAPAADPDLTNSGASYVVFGKAGGFAANLELSALNGNTGFEIRGEAVLDGSGFSVASAGDVNDDGFADLIIGAVGANSKGQFTGATYVVFGHRALASVTRIGTDLDQTINGGKGSDLISGGGGFDKLIGWESNDTYFLNDLSRTKEGIAFDTVVENKLGGTDKISIMSLDNRSGSDGYTLGLNIENAVITGQRGFFLTGNSASNEITGNASFNRLQGLSGNDSLSGGDGADTLTGGAGQDFLNGGAQADIFDYNSMAETGTTSATRDQITGFTHLSDKIDLSSIDAIAGGADDPFVFRGTHDFTAAGQVRLEAVKGGTLVEINTVGASVAEATILLTGAVATLTAADFVL